MRQKRSVNVSVNTNRGSNQKNMGHLVHDEFEMLRLAIFIVAILPMVYSQAEIETIKCYKCTQDPSNFRHCGPGEKGVLGECHPSEKYCYFRQSEGVIEKGCAYSSESKPRCTRQGPNPDDVLCVCPKQGCNKNSCYCVNDKPAYDKSDTVGSIHSRTLLNEEEDEEGWPDGASSWTTGGFRWDYAWNVCTAVLVCLLFAI